MTKLTSLTAAVAAALLIAGCENNGGIPESSIYVLDRDTGQIIATAETPGQLTLVEGEVFDFKVERLQHSSDDTETSDVTTVSSYWFIPEGIATANNLGELRALSPGTTQLEVRFHPDDFTTDHVRLNITVEP